MPIIIAIIISVVAVVTVGAAGITINVVQKNLKSIKTIKDTIQNQVNTIEKSRTLNDFLFIDEPERTPYYIHLADILSRSNIRRFQVPSRGSARIKSIEASTKPEKIIEEKKQMPSRILCKGTVVKELL